MKYLAFTISITGIILLLLIINTSEPQTTEIPNLHKLKLYTKVKITGQVISRNTYENNFTILELKDKTGKINIICNCPEIQKQSNITVIGKLQKYENQLQVNADKIERIS